MISHELNNGLLLLIEIFENLTVAEVCQLC